MKTTKIFTFTATIVLLSLFATSCIPTIPGGNPTPTNTFDVNINIDAGAQTGVVKTIVIDNDSLTFGLVSYSYYGTVTYFAVKTNSPNFEILNVKQDGFNLYTNAYDTTHYYADPSDVNTLDSETLINNSYNANPWIPFLFSGSYYSTYFSKLFQFNYDGYQYLTQGMPRNKNQYIVLRKLKGTQYQYYWIRVRNDDSAPLVITGGDCRINTKILNGKYQLNSITTGQ